MNKLQFVSHSPEETQKLGKKLGQLARAEDIFLLTGPLGAGKTCLTQGVAWGLDIEEYTLSPSFVLVRELHGRLPLFHADLYRLERIEEIAELGLEEYLYGKGVTVIEWAEKGLEILPHEHLHIHLNYVSENERQIEIEPHGGRYTNLLAELKSELNLRRK